MWQVFSRVWLLLRVLLSPEADLSFDCHAHLWKLKVSARNYELVSRSHQSLSVDHVIQVDACLVRMHGNIGNTCPPPILSFIARHGVWEIKGNLCKGI